MEKNKGQTSIEFLLLLAAGLVIFIVIASIAQSQIGQVSIMREQSDAVNSIRDLNSAAKEVYAQGEGAKKQVYIHLPSSYEPENSYVSNRTINLKVRGTDYAAVEDFDVHGTLPGTSGGHWIWVISEGNRVRIGYAMITTSRNSIYLIMDRNSSTSISFYVESLWDKNTSVSLSDAWGSTDVSMGYGPASFQLSPSERQTIVVNFNADEDAVGFHSGEIDITAAEGGASETIRIPVTVELAGYDIDPAPPLYVIPDFWAETLQPSDSSGKSFSVCTNSVTSVTEVTFAPSPGAPGLWVGNISPLGAIAAGSCQQKILNLSVPAGALAGTYNGSISVTGQGATGAQDEISLFVVVEAAEGSCALNQTGFCDCPVGAVYWDTPVCNCQPATVYVRDGIIVGGLDNGMPYNGTLRGSAGADIIAGTEGADTITTEAGNDIVCGHGGNDTIYGSNSNDIINGGEGDDVIYGQGSNDKIYGEGGADSIYGGQGADEIDGGSGNDVIYGGEHNDLIYGGPGSDTIYGEGQDDIICGNSEADSIEGGDGKDLIDGGTGSNALNGDDGDDTCYRGETMISCENQPGGRYAACGSS